MITPLLSESSHFLFSDRDFTAFLNAHNLILHRYTFPQRIKGIYFLIQGGEVRYIGQTVDLPSRISHHLARPPASFGEVVYFPWKGNLLEPETHWTRHFNPVGNRDHRRRLEKGRRLGLRPITKAAALEKVSEARAREAMREYLLHLGYDSEAAFRIPENWAHSTKQTAIRIARLDGTADRFLWSGATIRSIQPNLPYPKFQTPFAA